MYRAVAMWHAAVAIVVMVCAAHATFAQRNNTSPIYAWSGMNNNFLYQDSSGYDHFATTVGGSSPDGFWQQAEEIEMAVDAYVWAKTYDSSHLSTYQSELVSLCNGFYNLHGHTWTSDTWNDDIDIAAIAFTRAYIVLGTAQYLTDAENNLTAVWNRAQQGNGGLCENTGGGLGCYENSSVNWSFVIAADLIYQYNGHQGNYHTEAAGVYSWAKANLYNASGLVCDGPGCTSDGYSYNYGFAIGAASEQADGTVITNVANYLMNDLTNYAGVTSTGYNILPNYGQGATDNDGGFNGIAMRWISVANAHGSISTSVLNWAKANVDQAWSIRDSQELMWDDWAAQTPSTTGAVYSWDCSSAMVGMFDIPTA